MSDEMSLDESRRIMAVATDIRPDENVHDSPALSVGRAAKGRPVTAQEAKRIMAVATDIRPMENMHPDGERPATD